MIRGCGCRAYSGADNYRLWGPPPARDTVAINVDPRLLRREFAHVTEVAVGTNGLGVADGEEGAAGYVATGLRVSRAAAWHAIRNYS